LDKLEGKERRFGRKEDIAEAVGPLEQKGGWSRVLEE